VSLVWSSPSTKIHGSLSGFSDTNLAMGGDTLDLLSTGPSAISTRSLVSRRILCLDGNGEANFFTGLGRGGCSRSLSSSSNFARSWRISYMTSSSTLSSFETLIFGIFL